MQQRSKNDAYTLAEGTFTPGEENVPDENTSLLGEAPSSPPQLVWYHPTRLFYRSLILLLASFMCTGLYMSYDSIGATAPFLKGTLELDESQLGDLLAVYSLPNVVLAFVGGILTDKFGWRTTSLVFTFFVVLGNAVVAFATNYNTMLAGRFIVGLGGESLLVSQTVVLSQWFTGRELGLAFGCSLSIGWLGSLSSYWVLPPIASSYGFRSAFGLVLAVCIASALSNAVLILLDWKAKGRRETQSFSEEKEGTYPTLGKKLWHPLFWLNLITVNCFFGAMTIVQALTYYLTAEWGFSEENAARVTSINYILAVVFSPVFGFLADVLGRRNTLMFIGLVTLVPTFFLLTFTNLNPIPLVVSIGFSYALVPSIVYTAIPLIIDPKYVATAFGINYSLYDLSIFVTPLIFWRLFEAFDGDYTFPLMMLTTQAALALIATTIFWYIDWKYYNGFFQLPSPGAPNISVLFKKLLQKVRDRL